jgi:diadenosine tetraphosphate (Ap4A) HIT family hydrolase
MFVLHEQLANDTVWLGNFPLSQVLLMNDIQYPWCILVPQRPNIRESYELDPQDQQQLCLESACLSSKLMEIFIGHKMNVAALGNVVPQLHIHHLVRYQHDIAWPKPVWGLFPAKSYPAKELLAQKNKLINALSCVPVGFQPATI